MESEKSKLQIAIQAQKVAEKEAETQRRKISIEAEARAEVSKIAQLQAQHERESERIQSETEDKVLCVKHQNTLLNTNANCFCSVCCIIRKRLPTPRTMPPNELRLRMRCCTPTRTFVWSWRERLQTTQRSISVRAPLQ